MFANCMGWQGPRCGGEKSRRLLCLAVQPFVTGSHMNPKQPDRRNFLKNGAALAGLAGGASARALPLAAEPAPERIDDLHKYGERSRFVTSERDGCICNPERRLENEPRAFGMKTPLQDSVGM